MSERRDVVILGSTGSVGTQALDVVRANPDRFRVVGLTAGGSQPELFEKQVAEFAPAGRKNLANAITYSGVPLGSLLAALTAILLLEAIGWRGMFLIGALPLVTLLPLAFLKMPESPAWLASRGRVEEARAVAARTGVPLAALCSNRSMRSS